MSPHNIMVTYAGTTKLLDFGIARLSSIDASFTAAPKGKTAYLAPEQVTLGKIDRRVDIYALGLVLYELLKASRLFARETILRRDRQKENGAQGGGRLEAALSRCRVTWRRRRRAARPDDERQ